MDEGFELHVRHNNKELVFPAHLLQLGYIYKIQVDVFGSPVLFDRDEEGAWRAILEPSDAKDEKTISVGLLQVIADTIDSVT